MQEIKKMIKKLIFFAKSIEVFEFLRLFENQQNHRKNLKNDQKTKIFCKTPQSFLVLEIILKINKIMGKI